MDKQKLDRLSKHFGQFPYCIVTDRKLSPIAQSVFLILTLHADNTTREGFPGLKTIAYLANRGVTTIMNALKELEDGGYIKRRKAIKNNKQLKNNVYDLSPAWEKSDNYAIEINNEEKFLS